MHACMLEDHGSVTLHEPGAPHPGHGACLRSNSHKPHWLIGLAISTPWAEHTWVEGPNLFHTCSANTIATEASLFHPHTTGNSYHETQTLMYSPSAKHPGC